MTAYATVEEYRICTGDEASDDVRIESLLEQQSAKLRAECRIGRKAVLTEEQAELARALVVDASRKALMPVTWDGVSDITGASSAAFSANGFQSSVTLSNPSGAAYFDRSTLKAFKRSLGCEQRIGYVYVGGAL